ncbi:Transmembrane BAX inhibitor motif-containing protein 4 [Perkinsus chesapeaki]|uniref:Transmembrane BAX inhibitor motif-containing protein 4 n=1 Tax=Perkinsus chesapeaki TaxID=330153 RepID=A0A7J6LII3_PERCH|nr:Transmembrane BAX inhibitor motif-containing protein 4 [Perkinsus chesapeaki]
MFRYGYQNDYGYSQSPPPPQTYIGAAEVQIIEFGPDTDKNVRNNFIKKVYGILCAQLVVTTMIAFPFVYGKDDWALEFVNDYVWVHEQTRHEYTILARQLRGASKSQVDLRARLATVEAENEEVRNNIEGVRQYSIAQSTFTSISDELREEISSIREQVNRLNVGLMGVGGKIDNIAERDDEDGTSPKIRSAQQPTDGGSAAVMSLITRQMAAVKETCFLQTSRRCDELIALISSNRTEIDESINRAKETAIAQSTRDREEALRSTHDDLVSLIRSLVSEEEHRGEAVIVALEDRLTTETNNTRKTIDILREQSNTTSSNAKTAMRSAAQALQQLEALSRGMAETYGKSFNVDQAKSLKNDLLEKMGSFEVGMVDSLKSLRKEVSGAQEALREALTSEASLRAEESRRLAVLLRDNIKAVNTSMLNNYQEMQKQMDTFKKKMQRRATDDADRSDRLTRYIDDELNKVNLSITGYRDTFNDRIQGLTERITDMAMEGKEDLDQLYQKIREEVDEVSSSMVSNNGQIRELLTNEVTRLEAMQSEISTRSATAAETEAKRYEEKQRHNEDRLADLAEECRKIRKALRDDKSVMEMKIREEVKLSENGMAEVLVRYKRENRQYVANELGQRDDELRRRLEELTTDGEERRKKFESRVEATERKLKDRITRESKELSRELEGIRIALNKTAKINIDSSTEEIGEMMMASEKRIVDSCEHLVEVEKMRTVNLVEERTDELHKRWLKKDKDSVMKIQKIVTDLYDKIGIMEKDLRQGQQVSSRQVEADMDDTKAALRATQEVVKSGNRSLIDSIDRAMKAMQDAEAQQRRRLDATKDGILERTRVRDEATRKLIEEVALRVDSQKIEADGKIHEVDEKVQAQIMVAATKISSGIESIERSIGGLGKVVSSTSHDMNMKVARLSAESAAEAERYEMKIEESKREISDKCAVIDGQLRNLISSLDARTREDVEDLSKHLEKGAEKMQKDVKVMAIAVEEIKKDVDERERRINRGMEKRSADMKASMQLIEGELAGRMNKLDEGLSASTRKLTEKLEKVTEDLKRTVKDIEQLVNDKVDGVQSDVDAYVKRLQDDIDNTREACDAVVADESSRQSRKLNETVVQFKKLLEDRTVDLKQKHNITREELQRLRKDLNDMSAALSASHVADRERMAMAAEEKYAQLSRNVADIQDTTKVFQESIRRELELTKNGFATKVANTVKERVDSINKTIDGIQTELTKMTDSQTEMKVTIGKNHDTQEKISKDMEEDVIPMVENVLKSTTEAKGIAEEAKAVANEAKEGAVKAIKESKEAKEVAKEAKELSKAADEKSSESQLVAAEVQRQVVEAKELAGEADKRSKDAAKNAEKAGEVALEARQLADESKGVGEKAIGFAEENKKTLAETRDELNKVEVKVDNTEKTVKENRKFAEEALKRADTAKHVAEESKGLADKAKNVAAESKGIAEKAVKQASEAEDTAGQAMERSKNAEDQAKEAVDAAYNAMGGGGGHNADQD